MSDIAVSYDYPFAGRDFGYFDRNRREFQQFYARKLAQEPRIEGRVLDIGCGHGSNPALIAEVDGRRVVDRIGALDGVDPFPMVEPAVHLENRWTCRLEDIPVADMRYDMAYSYNVVEHVADVDGFLSKAVALLKPGGVYWSMSPNARHPFTWATRASERLGLKNLYVRHVNGAANDYPAYYRVSHDRRVLRAIARNRLPVSRVDFFLLPSVQWDMYFPRRLRAIPHLVDRAFLLGMKRASFILMFRMERAGAEH